MTLTPILEFAGNGVYIALGLVALYGVFCVVLLVRRVAQKRFGGSAASRQFLEDVDEHLEQRRFEKISELCDTPPFWSQAVPQLMSIAVENRNRRPTQLRRIVAETFEHEVLADLEYRASWISTIVKSAPMLGLLGTVIGMINAFAKIAETQQAGGDPSKLADDISYALFTTALGLTIAIPLVLAGAMINVRIGRLQDSVQQSMSAFLDELVESQGDDRRGAR